MKSMVIRLSASILFMLMLLDFLNAQEGYPYMYHMDFTQYYDRHVFDIEQDIDQVMLFAVRKGIYVFDSEGKKLLSTPHTPLVLKSDPLTGLIYLGCRNDIACIKKGPDGQYTYHSLLKPDYSSDEYYLIEQDHNHVYFAGERNLFRVRKDNPEDILHFEPDSGEYFAGMISHHNKIYINIIKLGLFEVTDSGLIRLDTGDDIKNADILFSFPLTVDVVLVGTDENRLLRFNGQSFNDFEIEDQQYLNESIISDGIEIDTVCMALSTLLGGCLVIDKRTGKTIHTINIQTGLPDDEINSIGKDKNNGIWLSHAYGVSRIATRLPVRNYILYPGIKGIPVSSTVLGNELYVSTNEGVYYLAEKKDYITKEVYIKVEKETEPEAAPESEEEKEIKEVTIPGELEDKLSRREIRKLRRQLKKETREAETDEEQAQQETEKRDLLSIIKETITKGAKDEELEQEKKETIYKKQKIYSLQSISHEFIKIPGLTEKADHLVNCHDRILAGGPAGLFEIIDHQAKPLFPDWNVEFMKVSEIPGRIFISTDESTYLLKLSGEKWEILYEFVEIPAQVFSVCEDNHDMLWFGCDNIAYNVSFKGDSVRSIRPFNFYGEVYDPVFTKKINDTIFFFLASGIYSLIDDTINICKSENYAFEFMPEYYFSEKGIAWIHLMTEWYSFQDSGIYNPRLNAYLNLFEKIQQIFVDDENNLWIIHDNGRLDKIISAAIPGYQYHFNLFLSSVTDQNAIFYDFRDLLFKFDNRSIVFDFSAPSYLSAQPVQYQYYIEGANVEWSDWMAGSEFSFPMIFPGKYWLHIRARDILGKVSNEFVVGFSIRPPFWLTWWFFGICALVLISLVILIIRQRLRKLRLDKVILEQKVWERTAEIKRQKNEIETQKEEIMDSIHYAQRIQNAILPSPERIRKILPENFILFLPRDIVSGDFYWMTRQGDHSVFAVADCTGHGVPGAFMSMLGVSFLNEIVNNTSELKANIILEQLRILVKTTLSQSDKGESKDGMDIALCILNHKKLNLQYAGAFNPLYLIRNNELREFKADRMPIGFYHGYEANFTNHELKLKKSDCLYIFSDGYIDQIGGEIGKKFLSKTMKDILLSIYQEPMLKQKEILLNTLKHWMGDFQQVDDILMIGIRI